MALLSFLVAGLCLHGISPQLDRVKCWEREALLCPPLPSKAHVQHAVDPQPSVINDLRSREDCGTGESSTSPCATSSCWTPEAELLMRSLLKQSLFDKNLIDNHKALRDRRLQMEAERNSVCIVLRNLGSPRKETGGEPQYHVLAHV